MTEPQRIEFADLEPQERSRFASRKFLLAVLVVLLAAGLLAAGRIGDAAWVEVTIWAAGLYMAGNGLSAFAAAWGRR
jgi:hypothetical protein